LADHRGQLEQPAKRKFAAPDSGRLQHAEQAARMQIGNRFVRQATQLFGPRSTFAEHWDECLGAREEFLEARCRPVLMGLRLGHSILFGKGPAACSLLISPPLGDILSTCQSP